jgi:hypothetical protein
MDASRLSWCDGYEVFERKLAVVVGGNPPKNEERGK